MCKECHDDLCVRAQCEEVDCHDIRHVCQCGLIEKVEARTRKRIEQESLEYQENFRLYSTAILIREGDEVWVKVDDGDKIHGSLRGKAVRVGPKRTGVTVCGVSVLDHNAKQVSSNIKDLKILRLAGPDGTPSY